MMDYSYKLKHDSICEMKGNQKDQDKGSFLYNSQNLGYSELNAQRREANPETFNQNKHYV